MTRDYTAVTELPGSKLTPEQHERIYQRYHLAKQYAAGKRVLEVACGAGIGLSHLAMDALAAFAGDYTEHVVQIAHTHYGERVPILCFDAHDPPFQDNAFDVIVNFEAIYYFADPQKFIGECKRMLTHQGVLVIGLENKEYPHFAPGPMSVQYYSAPELHAWLCQAGFSCAEFLAGFPVANRSLTAWMRAAIRRVLINTGIFSAHPALRERFKPLLYRHTTAIGYEIEDGMAPFSPLTPVCSQMDLSSYKVIFAIAHNAHQGYKSHAGD